MVVVVGKRVVFRGSGGRGLLSLLFVSDFFFQLWRGEGGVDNAEVPAKKRGWKATRNKRNGKTVLSKQRKLLAEGGREAREGSVALLHCFVSFFFLLLLLLLLCCCPCRCIHLPASHLLSSLSSLVWSAHLKRTRKD